MVFVFVAVFFSHPVIVSPEIRYFDNIGSIFQRNCIKFRISRFNLGPSLRTAPIQRSFLFKYGI